MCASKILESDFAKSAALQAHARKGRAVASALDARADKLPYARTVIGLKPEDVPQPRHSDPPDAVRRTQEDEAHMRLRNQLLAGAASTLATRIDSDYLGALRRRILEGRGTGESS